MKASVNQSYMAFSRAETASLVQLSQKQLSDWAAARLYGPKWGGSGFYSFVDLVALRTLSKLRTEHKIPPRELAKAGAYLRKHAEQPWTQLKLGVGPKNRIYFWDKQANSWLSADDAGQKIATVALDAIGAQVQRDVDASRARPKNTVGRFEQKRGVCGGRLRIAGTRVTVEAVRELLAARKTTRQILGEFPTLTAQDVTAVRNLAAA